MAEIDKINKLAEGLKGGLLEQWAKVSNADINIPDAIEEYRKIAEQYLKDGKVTITDKSGKTVDFTKAKFDEAANAIKNSDAYKSVVKNLQDIGLITPEGQLSPSQKSAQEAYDRTKDAVTEQLAIRLKKGGAIVDLARMGGVAINVPQTDDEYLRIANDLITKRKFTIVDKIGNTEEVSIDAIDDRLAKYAESTEEDKKKDYAKMKEALGGAKNFDELIPDEEKREKIARAVEKSVKNNTGDIGFLGGATFMDALIGLLKWVFLEGMSGGFDGLKASIAKTTADSIAQDTTENLRSLNIGLSDDLIKKAADSTRSTVLAKAKVNDPNAAPVETLASVSAARPTETPQLPAGTAQQGAGADVPAAGATAVGAGVGGATGRTANRNGAAGSASAPQGNASPGPTAETPVAPASTAVGATARASILEKTITSIVAPIIREKKSGATDKEIQDAAKTLTAEFTKPENQKLFTQSKHPALAKKLAIDLYSKNASLREYAKTEKLSDGIMVEGLENQIAYALQSNAAKLQEAIVRDNQAAQQAEQLARERVPAAQRPAGTAAATPQAGSSPSPSPSGTAQASPPPAPQVKTLQATIDNFIRYAMNDKGEKPTSALSAFSAARQKTILVSPAAMKEANRIIAEELNKPENTALLADGGVGSRELLSENLTKKLLANDTISKDIGAYSSQSTMHINNVAKILKLRIQDSLTLNGEEIKTAKAQNMANGTKHALNGFNLNSNATTLAMRNQAAIEAGQNARA